MKITLKTGILSLLGILIVQILSGFIWGFLSAFGHNADLILIMGIFNIIYAFILILKFRKKGDKIFDLKKINLIQIVIVIFIGIMLSLFSHYYTEFFNVTAKNQQTIEEMAKNSNIIALILTLVISAPLIEELVFRKILFNVTKNKVIGLIISSLLFALLHDFSDPKSIFIYFVMGLTFGGVYYKTGSIELSMLVHFVNNLIAAIGLLYK
ncbi:CPBP family intramembrane glutamic endopeptidase [Pseudostreptobacillus hongkongensis]|uniref:CPBP family intramembrane glutamic endopeptidase n=1 Tax=Pseudostreptobacillus hongkongensis TaxID=1162717 RepID=UPI0008344BF7|nr:type II CAAX endopeptidase family protein [Pseudostreptobacillus hongkongensis]